MRLLISIGFAVVVVTLLGCSRTVIGGFHDSPDKKFRVYGRVYGAYGRSFMEQTDKTVRISIVALSKDEPLLFQKTYSVRGVDVGWYADWQTNNLVVTIYNQADQPKARMEIIRAVSYRFDLNKQKFIEMPSK